MESRFKIRKNILEKRDLLSFEKRKKKSETIHEKLLTLDQIKNSDMVFCYVDYKSEVDTKKLVSQLLQQGIKVAVPLTIKNENKLLAVTVSDIKRDLEPGYCTILEPKKELVSTSCIDPGKIDTIILPGSVFDKHCGRMGYGGGFYDRFIAYQAPKATRIGVCFDMQLVEKLALEPHDKKMDYVVTEKDFIKRSRTEEKQ